MSEIIEQLKIQVQKAGNIYDKANLQRKLEREECCPSNQPKKVEKSEKKK